MSDTDELNDIFDDTPLHPEQEAADPTPEPPQEEVAAEPDPTPAPQPAPEMVPVAVVGELRGENRALKERLAQLEARMSQPVQQEPKPIPDVLENPDGFTGHFQGTLAQLQASIAADRSEFMAVATHGKKAVDEAFQAAKDAGILDRFKAQRDPWGALVEWHKVETVRQEIGDDPEAYRERVKAEVAEQIRRELEAKQTAAAVAQAPSLAGQTSIGGRAAQAPTLTPLDDILGG